MDNEEGKQECIDDNNDNDGEEYNEDNYNNGDRKEYNDDVDNEKGRNLVMIRIMNGERNNFISSDKYGRKK